MFWEFDGEGKYRDRALRAGKSLEDVLLAEKRREDAIRGVTQWRLCRGGFRDIATPETLAAPCVPSASFPRREAAAPRGGFGEGSGGLVQWGQAKDRRSSECSHSIEASAERQRTCAGT